MIYETQSTKPIEDTIDMVDEELEEIRASLDELEADFLILKKAIREMGI